MVFKDEAKNVGSKVWGMLAGDNRIEGVYRKARV
jgi:hypothetical protein